MTEKNIPMEILIIIALILLNGVFSMSEIALISVRKTKLETDVKKGSKMAKAALDLSNQPTKFLSTVQIGITLIGILTGLYSGDAFAPVFSGFIARHFPLLSPYAMAIAKTTIVIVVTYLTLVLGELVPKRLGMDRAESISKIMAKPMQALSIITSPAVWLLSKSTNAVVKLLRIKADENNKVTEDEIKAIVKEGFNVGEVQEIEQDIVERVFSLGDRHVDSIMTHRNNLVWIDMADSREKIKEKVMENMHDVYPVIDGNFDQILGVVYLKDLFGKIDLPGFSLRELLSKAQYLPENRSVYSSLEQLKEANVKYGIVTDEFGDIQGIVTLTDIMEALVGQVHEKVHEKDIIVREDGTFLVEGQCSFYNFLEYFDMEDLYAEHDYNTLSGLILELLQHIPATGEKLSWNRFDFEIVDMDGARIDKVLVKLNDHFNKQ
jgi:putative hemolysin